MEKYLVSKTYEVVTQESAENGDCADHGFVFEDVPMTMEEIEQEIREQGYNDISSSYVPNNSNECREWINTVNPEYSRNYFEKGEEKFYSLHFKGMTNEQFVSMCKTAGIYVSTN